MFGTFTREQVCDKKTRDLLIYWRLHIATNSKFNIIQNGCNL